MNATNLTYSFNLQGVIQHSAYIVVGLSAFLSNCLIFLAIVFRKSKLEHFFYFVGALAFGDIIHGLGYLFAGARRLNLVLSGNDKDMVPLWQCAIVYPTVFFTYGREASTIMTLFVSIDRFVAIANMKVYLTLGKWYAIILISFAYLFVTVSVSGISYMSFAAGPGTVVSTMCYTDFPPTATSYSALMVVVLGFCSSFVMLCTLIIVQYQSSSSFAQIQQVQLKRQSKLTILIAFIVFSTLVLWTIPNTIAYLYSTNGSVLFTLLSPYMWCLTNFSATVNAMIFIYKNHEIRKVLLNIMKPPTVVSIYKGNATRNWLS